MSLQTKIVATTALNGQPAEILLINNPTVDDVIINDAKVEAFLIENNFPFVPRTTPYAVRDFLVRLRIE